MDRRRNLFRAMCASASGGKNPAAVSDIIWRGRNGVESGTDNVVNDIITGAGKLSDANYVGNNCLNFDGNDDINYGNVGASTEPYAKVRAKVSASGRQTWIAKGLGSTSTDWLFGILSGSTINFFGYNSGGSLTHNISADITSHIGNWAVYEAYILGSTAYIDINGVNVASGAVTGSIRVSANAAKVGVRSNTDYFTGQISDVEIGFGSTIEVSATNAEGLGATSYDRSGNDNDGTITGASWTTDDDVVPHNIKNGFRVAVQQTAPYIPALLDGSAAADGNPITNKPGYTHNGAESLIKQSDATMLGTAGDGTDTFWSADGVAQGSRSYADLRAHPNGAYTLWMKCIDINGVPHYIDLSQYTFGREFNAGETQKNENYYGDNCGTGQSALRDVNGDLVTDVDGNVIFTA